MIKVGEISQRVIDLLQLKVDAGTPIYIGNTNIAHMQTSHPDDYKKYKKDIPGIISSPDYVGINPKDQSIEYVKEYTVDNESVKVAIRVSAQNIFFARSVYARESDKVKRFIRKGYLVKY